MPRESFYAVKLNKFLKLFIFIFLCYLNLDSLLFSLTNKNRMLFNNEWIWNYFGFWWKFELRSSEGKKSSFNPWRRTYDTVNGLIVLLIFLWQPFPLSLLCYSVSPSPQIYKAHLLKLHFTQDKGYRKTSKVLPP